MRHQRPRTKSRCSATGNVKYPDKIAADTALALIQNRGPRRGQPEMKRSYDCRLCGGFHLTPEEQINVDPRISHSA